MSFAAPGDGTVHGGFELSADQALRTLRDIRDTGGEADVTLKGLGTTMDTLGGETSTRRLRTYKTALSDVGTTAENTAGRVSTSWETQTRVISAEAGKIERRLGVLEERFRRYGAIDASANVNLTGFDRVNAQLSELEARLDRLDARSVRSRVSIGGGFAGGGGMGGGGGGGQGVVAGDARSGLFSSLGGIPGRLPWWAAALPLAPQLIGGAGALIGSAGAGVLGAGAVGAAGISTLAAGGGLTMAIAKPAISALGEVTKAQEAYNKAVDEFGKKSTQAVTAQRNLNYTLTQNPMAAGAARQLSLVQSEWRTATAPARQAFYTGASGVLYNARRMIPNVAGAATTATTATAGAATSFSGFLAQRPQQQFLDRLVAQFSADLPIAERSLQNITTIFENLTTAALPFFHEGVVWVDHWTAGMARSSSNTGKVRGDMQGLVTSAKDWARLTGAAARDIRDLFKPGVQPGNSMVVDLTHTLDRWDVWLQRNPGKVKQFFRDGVSGTERIAGVIGRLASDVWSVFRALDPILKRAEQFLSFASGLGGGNLATGVGLLYGGYQGIRGALGGGGPGPGAALRSVVGGSAGPLVFAGGSRAAGGTVVGGVPSVVGRASNLDVARGRTASGAFLMGGATVGTQAVLERRAAAAAAATDSRLLPGLRDRVATMVETSPLAARVADAAGTARGVALGAFAGVARFVGPLLLLQGALGALGAHGGAQARFGAGVSAATLGIVPPATAARNMPGILGAAPGAALSTFAPRLVSAGATRALGSVLGPQLLDVIGSRALGVLGGVGLGAAGAYAGYMINPASAGASLASSQGRHLVKSIADQANAVQTPDQLRTLTERVRFQPLMSEMSPADQQKLRAFLQGAVSTAASNAGRYGAGTFESAFQAGLMNPGHSPRWAVRTALAGIPSELAALKPKGARAFATATAAWVAQEEQANPALRRPLERLMNGIVTDLNRLSGHTGTTMKDIRDKVFFFNGQILQGASTTWQAIGKSLTDPMQVANEKMLGIFGQIQSEAVNALVSMGWSKSTAQGIVTATVKGGKSASQAASMVALGNAGGQANVLTGPGGTPKHARGGVIGGRGLLDTVPTPDGGLAAPGEAYIANRHTMSDLSSATLEKFGKTAWQMIRDEPRAHSAPMVTQGPMNYNRHARGGRYLRGGGFGGIAGSAMTFGTSGRGTRQGPYVYPFPGLSPGRTDQGYDLSGAGPIYAIGSGTVIESGLWPGWPGTGGVVYRLDSGPDAGSNVYYMEHVQSNVAAGQKIQAGQAIATLLPGYPFLEAGWANAAGTGPLTPYNGAADGTAMPGGSNFRAFVNALLAGGALPPGMAAGTAGATPSISLRAPRSGLRGVPGAMADQGSRIFAAGLQSAINKRIGASGGVGSISTVGGIMGIAQQAAAAAGVPWDASIVSTLLQKESGGGQNLPPSGSLSATGPFQVIPGTFQAYEAPGHGNISNPVDNALAAFRYIKSRYGTLSNLAATTGLMGGGYHGYSRGGRVNWAGWNAKGGDFVTNGPTLFGAGEGGKKEQVSIGPVGRDGRTIHVNISKVDWHANNTAQLDETARYVAGRILDALNEPHTSDAELAGAQA